VLEARCPTGFEPVSGLVAREFQSGASLMAFGHPRPSPNTFEGEGKGRRGDDKRPEAVRILVGIGGEA